MHLRRIRNSGRTGRIAAGLLLAAISLLGGAHNAFINEQTLARLEQKHGAPAARRIEYWNLLIQQNQNLDDLEKLQLVNDFFNQARFVDDIDLWGVRDYWATPLEFLIEDAGDCEDYSIAKYFTLRAMGVEEKKLRITYVTALELNQAHMVLAYYPTPSSVPLILDNLDGRIRPATERTDLRPVYSFNAEDMWLARSRTDQLRAGSPAQLGPWQDMLRRMQEMEKQLTGQQ